MTKNKIYTRQGCRYSDRALQLLDEKDIPYEEIDITDDPERQREMIEAAHGRTSSPQIFIDGGHIGGFDDLQEADRQGRLAGMLAADMPSPT